MILREEVTTIDRENLPANAIFKGHEEAIIQDIIFRAENVRFLKEKYYSPSGHKTYLAGLPAGYEGQFGPSIKAFVPTLYFGGGMTEPKILELLGYANLQISLGQLSNL